IAALPQLSEGRKVREHLELLLEDRAPHLRISAINAIEQLGDARARASLRRHLQHELDGRVSRRAREVLRSLADSTSASQKRLSDELETLRNEVSELKIKLSKLEGAGRHLPQKSQKAGARRAKRSPVRAKSTRAKPTRTKAPAVKRRTRGRDK